MTKKSLLLAAFAAVALNVSAFASTAQTSSPAPDATLKPRPVASSIVKPDGLPMEFAGAVINVEFSLDAAGQPHDIQVLRVQDKVLKKQLVSAFRQWRFEPGVGADLSSKRFILPVEITPEA